MRRLAMAVCLAMPLAAPAAPAAAAPIYLDTFDAFAPGSVLTNLTYTPAIGGTNAALFPSFGGIVTAVAFGGSTAAEINLAVGTAQDYLGQFFTTYTDIALRLDWDFTAAEVNGGFGGFFARFPTPSLDMQVLFGFFDDGRVIVFSDTPGSDTIVTIGSFVAGVTYHVTMALDLASDTYSVWVDGIPLLSGAPIPPHINATSMHQFGFDTNEAFPDSRGNRFTIDNVRVGIGAVPVPPALALMLTGLVVLGARGLRLRGRAR